MSVEAPNYGAHQRRQYLFLPYSGSKIQSEAGETLIASAAAASQIPSTIQLKGVQSQAGISGIQTN